MEENLPEYSSVPNLANKTDEESSWDFMDLSAVWTGFKDIPSQLFYMWIFSSAWG